MYIFTIITGLVINTVEGVVGGGLWWLDTAGYMCVAIMPVLYFKKGQGRVVWIYADISKVASGGRG